MIMLNPKSYIEATFMAKYCINSTLLSPLKISSIIPSHFNIHDWKTYFNTKTFHSLDWSRYFYGRIHVLSVSRQMLDAL